MVRKGSRVQIPRVAPYKYAGLPKRSTGADCKSAGLCLRGFESLTRHQADVAQLAEQLFCKQQVMGSSPFIGSSIISKSDLQEATSLISLIIKDITKVAVLAIACQYCTVASAIYFAALAQW